MKPSYQELEEQVKFLTNEINQLKAAKLSPDPDISLRKSFYDTILSHSKLKLALIDSNFKFLEASQEFARFYKKEVHDLIENNYFDLFPDQERKNIFKSLINNGNNYRETSQSFFINDKVENGLKYFDCIIIPVNFSEKKYHGLLIILTDITEQTITLNALKESEEKYRKIFENSPALIIITRYKDGKIMDVNPFYEKISGYDRSELVGRTTTDLCLLRDEERSKFLTEFQTKKKIEHSELSFYGKDGKEKCTLVSAESVMINNELHLVSCSLDITYIKENEKKLRAYTDELKHLNATKDKLFSIIAHDLKNPFQTLLGFSEFLASKIDLKDEKKVKNYANIINDSANKIYHLLENLLIWAQNQRGKIEFKPSGLNLRNIINDSLSIIKESIEKKDISVEISVDSHVKVLADENMLKIIIMNLLTNAYKFTNPGGTIRISSERLDAFEKIIINDNGLGMKKEELSKLFRIEVKNSEIGSSKEKGTGLGLLLCKEFVERNGGKISVHSTFGKGSSFFFTLPYS